ncbi:MAG: fumarylacetoacetate hydrolase family protein [Candidatus Neomarinimicrobiota bacterium]
MIPQIILFDGESIPVRNIYCVGRNYSEHARELGNEVPTEAIFFSKSSACLASGNELSLPDDSTIHHELEIVLLIGTGGYRIGVDTAWRYVAAVGLGLDLTDRALQNRLKEKKLPWFLSKSFRNSAFVTRFGKPEDLNLADSFWLKRNATTVQQGRATDMLFNIPELIRQLSARIPLLPGDLLYTGTPPGVGPLAIGDQLELGWGETTLAQIQVTASNK